MSADPMNAVTVLRWRAERLEIEDSCDVASVELLAADSWLVDEGRVLALELHRSRFSAAAAQAAGGVEATEVSAFWDAAAAALPRQGAWFPRVELRRVRGVPELRLLLRTAPALRREIRLATHLGRDPRTAPTVKGPDLDAMVRLRGQAQNRGADEAVILSPEGCLVEGATTALAWWEDDALAIPAPELARIDSVALRSVLSLAAAAGVDVRHRQVAPAELDGRELWALNALHGIRVATEWIDGPRLAQASGRVGVWRDRLDALRRPLPPRMRT